jgi:hypothetical protein
MTNLGFVLGQFEQRKQCVSSHRGIALTSSWGSPLFFHSFCDPIQLSHRQAWARPTLCKLGIVRLWQLVLGQIPDPQARRQRGTFSNKNCFLLT